MAAWPIKFTEGSKSGKKHPLPIDLSTENKKAKRSAYQKGTEIFTDLFTTFDFINDNQRSFA
jgi:hypothetical protein